VQSGEDYLARTLESLKTTTRPVGLTTDVLVFDPRGDEGANGPYRTAKAKFEKAELLGHGAGAARFHFESQHSPLDPFPGHQEPKDPNNSDIPGKTGRQHTVDIVTMLKMVLSKFGPGNEATCDYFLFMEDDFVMCDSMFEATLHAIRKSSAYNPSWSGLRISFGLNGLLVPCGDLPALSTFMMEKSSWRPADLLAVYWVGQVLAMRPPFCPAIFVSFIRPSPRHDGCITLRLPR
jgi:hypothetical protein